MYNDVPNRFTKSRKTRGYNDYLICGIGTRQTPLGDSPTHNVESITSYHIQHLRPARSVLCPVDDIYEFTDDNPIDSLLRHFSCGSNNLIVCNNSLVFLGSSDFVSKLESGEISLAKGKVCPSDLGRDGATLESTESFIVSAPPTIVTFIRKSTNAKYTIIDIANYGARYLEDIYGKLPASEKAGLSYSAWKQYETYDSLRSCGLMARYMQEYYKVCTRFSLACPTVSYAGQSLRAYRENERHIRIKTHHHEPTAVLERQSYGLGRGEAFFTGEYRDECYLLDINALYTHFGQTRNFPYELQDYQESVPISTIAEWCQDSTVILHGRIETDEPIYRCQHENRSVFPVGRFNGFLAGDECSLAIHRGHLRRCYRAARYRHGPILREYANHMAKSRGILQTEKNEIGAFIIKLITNGLWGRLGQTGSRWLVCDEIATPIRYGGFTELNLRSREQTYYRVLAGVPSKLVYAHFCPNTFPAISSVINGYSRSLLWNLIHMAGTSNVLYAAIDGLIISKTGLLRLQDARMIHASQNGMLRIVESADRCYIKCYGVYTIGSKTAYCGMPRANRHRTHGFWNQRSGECLDAYGNAYRVLAKTEALTPVAAREALREKRECPGSFTAPLAVYQSPLELPDQLPANYQPAFQFAAYGK